MAGTNYRIWLNLAKSDLLAAKLLYEHKQYRVSYSMFQQAVEKANKGFALMHGLETDKTLFDIRHDQFKIYRRFLASEENRIITSLRH